MSTFVCGVCGNTKPEEGNLYLVNSVYNDKTERYEEVGKTCYQCISPDLRIILESHGKTKGAHRELGSEYPDQQYNADPRS